MTTKPILTTTPKEETVIFNENKGSDVMVTPVSKAEIPFAFSYVDISTDTSYWVNRCVALHYGLKTVRVSSN